MEPETLFALNGATLRIRDRWILRNTSWTIGRGEHWAVVGPNGSGKTTLLGAVIGKTPVVAGEVYRADGLRVGFAGPEHHRAYLQTDSRREITWSPVTSSYPITTGAMIIERSSADPDLAARLVTGLGVHHLLGRSIRTLSTGEMKKILLVATVASRPDLLLLDEPFDGLDAQSREWFAGAMSEIAGKETTLVLATHRADEIVAPIAHYVELSGGTLTRSGEMGPGFELAQTQTAPTASTATARPNPPQRPAMVAGEPLIELRDVNVRYNGHKVLSGLSWTMRRGENWCITGPNGSGKTTLLDLICGNNLQAYANHITLFGRRRGSGESIWDIKRNVGFVTPHLQARYDSSISVREVIISGFFDSIGLYRRPTTLHLERYQRLAQELGLHDLGDKPFDRLSSGERTLVLIARAVIKQPKILVLDEPCQGLDLDRRAQVICAVDKIGTGADTDLIYVTHQPDEVPSCITNSLDLAN